MADNNSNFWGKKLLLTSWNHPSTSLRQFWHGWDQYFGFEKLYIPVAAYHLSGHHFNWNQNLETSYQNYEKKRFKLLTPKIIKRASFGSFKGSWAIYLLVIFYAGYPDWENVRRDEQMILLNYIKPVFTSSDTSLTIAIACGHINVFWLNELMWMRWRSLYRKWLKTIKFFPRSH